MTISAGSSQACHHKENMQSMVGESRHPENCRYLQLVVSGVCADREGGKTSKHQQLVITAHFMYSSRDIRTFQQKSCDGC